MHVYMHVDRHSLRSAKKNINLFVGFSQMKKNIKINVSYFG